MKYKITFYYSDNTTNFVYLEADSIRQADKQVSKYYQDYLVGADKMEIETQDVESNEPIF
jgi:hypothetical protein